MNTARGIFLLFLFRHLLFRWNEGCLGDMIQNVPDLWKLNSEFVLSRPNTPNLVPTPVLDWLLPLCSGPGQNERRTEHARETFRKLGNLPHHYDSNCGMIKDARRRTSALYAATLGRTELLSMIMRHEGNW